MDLRALDLFIGNNSISGAPVVITQINGECANSVMDRFERGLFWFCVM